MSRFQGKKAVVVGGTHGMGLSVAEALAAGGAEVQFTDRNEKNLAEARQTLDGGVHVVRADLSA
jgi:NAD(P)-dependent dehydrogenase (short-subunit alcohol dehydrogenase family)